MGNTQQSIQGNQLSQMELPFQFHSIPKTSLQINNQLDQASRFLVVRFHHSAYLENNNTMMNISLEELLQSITIRKMSNCIKILYIRNYEKYRADSISQASMQSDCQALLILLYFFSMNNQLDLLNINWKSQLSFSYFNNVMNLVASFQNLKSLVLKMSCNQITNPDDQVSLRSFSSRISCQINLTSLNIALNLNEYNINSLEFLAFLTDLSNLLFLETIILKFLSKVYSDIAIDSLIVLSLHPSLKNISIQSYTLKADSIQNKNISETYLNQLKSSSLQSIYLEELQGHDFNLLFAILTRLPFLKKLSINCNFGTSNIDFLRFPIIPYKRNITFPVLESIEFIIDQALNVQFAQELLNGLSQFQAYQISWFLRKSQGVNYSDLGLEKTLIAMSQGEIMYKIQGQSSFENEFLGILGVRNYDLLKKYISFKKSVCLSICAFKKLLWSYMMYNPLHIILDLHMD